MNEDENLNNWINEITEDMSSTRENINELAALLDKSLTPDGVDELLSEKGKTSIFFRLATDALNLINWKIIAKLLLENRA